MTVGSNSLPPSYKGVFYASINGQLFPLTAFAGCFDKIIGVEYEDCYFSTGALQSSEVLALLDGMVQGNNLFSNITVHQLSETGTPIARLEIGYAFIREFNIMDFDAAGSANTTISFVAVPRLIQSQSPAPILNLPSRPEQILQGNFRVNITNINGTRIAAVRGLRMSSPKIPALVVGETVRHTFFPGSPVFDDIRLDASASGGATIADLETWVNQVEINGVAAKRDGEIEILNSVLTLVGRVHLFDLVPRNFPIFGTGAANLRQITLQVGGFTITGP